MPKIIVQRKTYASSSPHSDEIKRVVQEDLIANQLSEATNVAASVGLVKSATKTVTTKPLTIAPQSYYSDRDTNFKSVTRCGNVVHVSWSFKCDSLPANWTPIITGLPRCVGGVLSSAHNIWKTVSVGVLMPKNGTSISLTGGEAGTIDYWLDLTYITDEEG